MPRCRKQPALMTDDEVGLVNCADCSVVMLGERTALRLESQKEWPRTALGKKPVYSRVHGRPYCFFCYRRMDGDAVCR